MGLNKPKDSAAPNEPNTAPQCRTQTAGNKGRGHRWRPQNAGGRVGERGTAQRPTFGLHPPLRRLQTSPDRKISFTGCLISFVTVHWVDRRMPGREGAKKGGYLTQRLDGSAVGQNCALIHPERVMQARVADVERASRDMLKKEVRTAACYCAEWNGPDAGAVNPQDMPRRTSRGVIGCPGTLGCCYCDSPPPFRRFPDFFCPMSTIYCVRSAHKKMGAARDPKVPHGHVGA